MADESTPKAAPKTAPAAAKPAETSAAVQATHADEAEARKAQTAADEQTLERKTGQDFEVGGTEDLYLAGGSAADLAYAQREEQVEKLRVEQGMAAAGNPPAED
jgi:hypothetical protein